jgi:hypothetical protein
MSGRRAMLAWHWVRVAAVPRHTAEVPREMDNAVRPGGGFRLYTGSRRGQWLIHEHEDGECDAHMSR